MEKTCIWPRTHQHHAWVLSPRTTTSCFPARVPGLAGWGGLELPMEAWPQRRGAAAMAAGVPTCQGKFLSHDGATMAAAEAESRGSAALRPSDPWGSRSWRAGASREEIGHRRAPSRLPHASSELKKRIGNVLMYNVSIFCKKEKIKWKYSYTVPFII